MIYAFYGIVVKTQRILMAATTNNVPSAAAASGLTWADTFYDDESDIVAVFDLDEESILAYHKSMAFKEIVPFFGLLAIAITIAFIAIGLIFISFYCNLISCIYIIKFVKAWKKVRATKANNIHIAITSSSVRYDQEDPFISKEVRTQQDGRSVRVSWRQAIGGGSPSLA